MATIPEYLIRHVEDKRLRRLINKVWQRLPACDRHVLRELLFSISDEPLMKEGDNSGIAYSEGITNSVMDGCAAQAVQDMPFIIMLCRAAELESDAACIWVIAHELAHIVLRHPQMSLLIESLLGFEPEPIYTLVDACQLYEWNEDAADLQAWLWGFRDEYEAILQAIPARRRGRWYVDIETEELGSPERVPV